MYSKSPKVFIIDDEQHVREMLKLIMTSINFEVIGEACNGREAVEFLKGEKPDLIMLDINMPYERGDKLLDEISNDTHDSCIIMLSILSDAEVVKKCIEKGASYFIRKDTPLPQMIETIKKTWTSFEESRRKLNSNKYNLNEMLEKIARDEKLY